MVSREWLEQVINSRISPRITGIVIKPIPLLSGGTAYVIDIPQATTFAPHQANYRYFRRFNFESVPMEDYEVKDAMRRASVGDPYMRFGWSTAAPADDGSPRARLVVTAGNHANEPIIYAQVAIYLDHAISGEMTAPEWTRQTALFQIGDNQTRLAAKFYRNVLPSNHLPFFKESEWTMIDLMVPLPPRGFYMFGYTFAAPGVARRRFGLFRIKAYEITSESPSTQDMLDAGLPTA